MNGITVMQVFKSLGVNPEPTISWSVGSRMAQLWRDAEGREPTKELRPKTTGGGSHCFAIYPFDWRPAIERVIRETTDIAKSQGDLFGD